jgi:hypothetical protein
MRAQRLTALALIIFVAQALPSMADDKKLTTYERQVNLMKRVNAGQKNHELTAKQAKRLRKDLSKIAVKKQKSEAQPAGEKRTEGMGHVEEHLTTTSKKINKLKDESHKDSR